MHTFNYNLISFKSGGTNITFFKKNLIEMIKEKREIKTHSQTTDFDKTPRRSKQTET